jgi:16S rRNA (guanine527-N7)-methyltransferase
MLADAVGKKLKVVQDAARQLGLVNVETVHGRAEDLAKTRMHRERYDLVVSRAVANMSTLAEYCLPFAKVGGFFIAYKTRDAMDEIEAASGAISRLGGHLVRMDSAQGGHILVVIEKVARTPAGYPRKAGTPGKEPLK